MRRFLLYFVTITLLLCACNNNKVYDYYHHTLVSGWDKVDVLSYDVAPLAKDGNYAMRLGLRINDSYPFQRITLIVDQTVYPSGKKQADTLNCELFDRKGIVRGQGVSYFQYHFRVAEQFLQKGDSLHITVRHDMKREIMPGIADVGIELERTR